MWMPGDPATRSGQLSLTGRSDEATQAFVQPLPDGRYVRFSPTEARQPWFPISEIVRDVAEVRGPDASPETLSVNEELYDFRPLARLPRRVGQRGGGHV